MWQMFAHDFALDLYSDELIEKGKRAPNRWGVIYVSPKGNTVTVYNPPLSTPRGFSTFEQLQNNIGDFPDSPFDNSAFFVVLKNADFTEGRGPMVLTGDAYRNYDDAVDYIMSQDGIYGSKQYSQWSNGVNVHGEIYAYVTFNGYEIRAIAVS